VGKQEPFSSHLAAISGEIDAAQRKLEQQRLDLGIVTPQPQAPFHAPSSVRSAINVPPAGSRPMVPEGTAPSLIRRVSAKRQRQASQLNKIAAEYLAVQEEEAREAGALGYVARWCCTSYSSTLGSKTGVFFRTPERLIHFFNHRSQIYRLTLWNCPPSRSDLDDR